MIKKSPLWGAFLIIDIYKLNEKILIIKSYDFNKKLFCTNITNFALILLVIFIALVPFKYVYDFTINQVVFLKLFVIFSCYYVYLKKMISNENILLKKSNLNLPPVLFIFNNDSLN